MGNVKSFEKVYYIGKGHKVRRVNPETNLTPSSDKDGYLRVGLSKHMKVRYFKVHRLVAETFIPNSENKPEVNHIDGNKKNNCVSNLEWVTSKENYEHAIKIGLRDSLTLNQDGINNPSAKFSIEQIKEIRQKYKYGDTEYGSRGLAKIYNCSPSTILNIVNNKCYKNTI